MAPYPWLVSLLISMNPLLFLLLLLLQPSHVHVLCSSVFDLSQIRASRNNDGPILIPNHLEPNPPRPIGIPKPVAITVSAAVPEHIPMPTRAPETINNTKKRKIDHHHHHHHHPAPLEDMPLQELIASESKKFKFHKQERPAQLLKTLGIIAANDHQAYERDEVNFKAIMGCDYAKFRKGQDDIYLMRYWIMFGADRFIPRTAGRKAPVFGEPGSDYGLEEAVRYLLVTKPLDQVFKTLARASVYKFDPEIRTKIHDLIFAKYPDLPHFQKVMIKLIGNTEELYNLPVSFSQAGYPNDSLTIFKDLVAFICKYHPSVPSDSQIIITLPLEYPQYYKNELPNTLKYGMVKAVIRADDPDILTQVLILDPEMYKMEEDSGRGRTILHDAIESRSPRCIRMILDTLPELATLNVPDRIIPALKYAIEFESMEFLQIIPDFPFIRYDLVLDQRFVPPLNLLQLALFKGATNFFKYFVNQAGILEARMQIRAQWPTDSSILLHFQTVCNYYLLHPLINYVVELMEIDLNATYKHNDLEGNAMIFLHESSCLFLINNLNRDAPCYKIIDGTKTKVSLGEFNWMNKRVI